MPLVSIVIINYKTAELTTNCIKSIFLHEKNIDFELIVVDNDSKDDIEKQLSLFPTVKFIQMGYNSGFSRANNAGMRVAKGTFVLLLNSDIYLTKSDTIKNSVDFLKTKTKLDVVAPLLLNQDNSYQCSARGWYFGLTDLLFANSFFIYFTRTKKEYRHERNKMDKLLHLKSGRVRWINGAFQLFNREIINKYQLFYDEEFFLYGEDVEWAFRVNKNGGFFYILTEESVVHLGSASSQKFNNLKNAQIELSNWLFIKKSFGVLYFIIYFTFDWFNIICDDVLEIKKHNKNSFREVKKYLYKKYLLKIIFSKKGDKKIKYNVYENDKEFISKKHS